MFAGKVGAYPSGAPLQGRLLTLPANWKRPTMDKHSSLFAQNVSYEVKQVADVDIQNSLAYYDISLRYI